ncbi:MAG: sugar phosphate isomerase/epimerase family protein [Saccharofermentanales bacterium]|jgi:sugar phosphate isomerase/epimerase
MGIKLGVSFYSYQQAYYTGQKNLEQLIDATANVVGAHGVELIPEQMPVGSYPDPSEADVERWFAWMEKYQTEPTCMDSFIDWMLYKNRILTKREQVDQMARDLKLASRLGFKTLRVLCPVRKEIVEASLPIAEHYGVKMGLEIHAPMTLNSRWTVEYMDMVVRNGSRFAGLIIDFGIFAKRPARKLLTNALQKGADPHILEAIAVACADNKPTEFLLGIVKEMGGGQAETGVAMSWARNRFSQPDRMRDYASYIIHCHGKFYDMDEQCNETGIDYQSPIAVLKDIGYNGYICSEFEGQRLYIGAEEPDEIEQVRRHHVMMRRLIG